MKAGIQKWIFGTTMGSPVSVSIWLVYMFKHGFCKITRFISLKTMMMTDYWVNKLYHHTNFHIFLARYI